MTRGEAIRQGLITIDPVPEDENLARCCVYNPVTKDYDCVHISRDQVDGWVKGVLNALYTVVGKNPAE
jgi:hypothetical protein